jgi:hypothetical protein
VGNKRNFLKLLMRFVRSDVRTTSLPRKTTTDLRTDTKEHRSGEVVQKSIFARFFASFDFRLLRQYRSIESIWPLAGDFRSAPMNGHRLTGPPPRSPALWPWTRH